ncbi:MAG: LL-diaminopimelate aminotransferase [Deltaproteobacteria bacterium]|nr:MAG: LL-diaminopimelate aminotransferase [Deltaproteobacteria bacterium]
MFELSERLKKLPPYLFKEIDQKKKEIEAKGIDVINLGVGDPDLPTPPKIIQAMIRAVQDPENHHYPSYSGMEDFKVAIAEWYKERFSVRLDPETEVISLIGAKEGIAHIPLAFINPDDLALIPTPAYPVYNVGTLFAGGKPYFLPLFKENGFLPDLASIPDEVAKKAKMIWLNYPNNPTTAVADRDFFESVIEFAHKYNVMVCHDLTYSEIAFDEYKPMSLLEIEGARDICIEFHSLSKSFNMTGWRIGLAVGNKEAISGLSSIKSNVDSGLFQAIQVAGIEALRASRESILEIKKIYARRRDTMVKGLRGSSFEVDPPKATFYLWVPVPHPYKSVDLATRLLTETGVVVTPGNGFGYPGEGYIRLALTQDESRLSEATERIKSIKL